MPMPMFDSPYGSGDAIATCDAPDVRPCAFLARTPPRALLRGSAFLAKPAPELRDPATPPAVTAAAPRTGCRRILLVDDNRDAAETTQTLLEYDGHQVVVAYTGLDALALAAQFAPDVVVLDIGLPDVDGYEVARRLRAQPDGGGLLLVALTGYGCAEDRRAVMAAGFDHHLVKPADPSRLAAVLASPR